MLQRAKFFLLLLPGLLLATPAQSGRRQQAPPSGIATAALVAVQVVSAPDAATAEGASSATERLAFWLRREDGLDVQQMTETLAAGDAQELARKSQAGYLVWVKLDAMPVERKDVSCSDPCKAKCLRRYNNYVLKYAVFAPQSGAVQTEGALEAPFAPERYTGPAGCKLTRSPEEEEKLRRAERSGYGLNRCLNVLPETLAGEALECLSQRAAEKIGQSLKTPSTAN